MHFSKARSRDGAPGLPSPSTPTGKLHVQGDSVLQEVEKLAIVEDSPSQPQTSPHAPRQADPQVCTQCICYMLIYISKTNNWHSNEENSSKR